MASYAVEEKRAEARGEVIREGGFIPKQVGMFGATNFKEEDEFIIPEDFRNKVHSVIIGTGDEANEANYILVEILNRENTARQLYPSLFQKCVEIYDAEGLPTGVFAESKGTAVLAFLEGKDTNDAFDKIAGKKLKITKLERVKTNKYDSTDTRWVRIPTIDFVD